MRVLLDNCVDCNVQSLFLGHEVKTAVEMGWDRLNNGELIANAALQFDVLVTTDKNVRYQQNLDKLPIAILELDAHRNRFKEIAELAAHIPAALDATRSYRFVSIHADGQIEVLSKR